MKRIITAGLVTAGMWAAAASPALAVPASSFADLSNQTAISPLATPIPTPPPSGTTKSGVSCSIVGQSSPFQATLTDGTVVTVVAQSITCTKVNKQGVTVVTEETTDFEIVDSTDPLVL